MTGFQSYASYEIALLLINILLILVIIFFERKTPSATLAWTLVLAFIPIVGFIFYLVFNQNLSRLKINRLLDKEEAFVDNVLLDQMDAFDKNKYVIHNKVSKKWSHLIHLNQKGGAIYTDNNECEFITDGIEYYKRLISDINNAKESVYVQFFILKPDMVGIDFVNTLTNAAKRGLDVRLMIDGMGSFRLYQKYLREFKYYGGKYCYFFKPKIFGLKINYRNHRKITVIDNRIGYTGGFNIAHEYLGLKKKFGYWRDTNLRVIGDAVFALKIRFIQDWRFTTGEDMNEEFNNSEMLKRFYNGSLDLDVHHKKGLQIVSSGPDSSQEEVKSAFIKMIGQASKNIYIQSPYFIPDPAILTSLKVAVDSGVDVRIMIPNKPDHVFVYWANLSYVGDLLRSGARIFVYENGFIHSKTMVVDNEICTVGSTNFDIRSFRLNFETNAFIYDGFMSTQLANTFINDMKLSHELTLIDYESRSTFTKFRENFARLFSDIL